MARAHPIGLYNLRNRGLEGRIGGSIFWILQGLWVIGLMYPYHTLPSLNDWCMTALCVFVTWTSKSYYWGPLCLSVAALTYNVACPAVLGGLKLLVLKHGHHEAII